MKRSEALIIKDLQDIDNQLSPENLTCDGELSSSEVEARQKLLEACWKKLEKELGRKVTSEELYPEIYGKRV